MPSPEALLISSILRDNDFDTALAKGANRTMIHAYPDEWAWLEQYFMKHKKTPSKVAFKTRFPDFRLKAANDTEHFVDEVRKSHTRIELTGVLREATQLLTNGDLDQAIEVVAKNIMSVAANTGVLNDSDILANYHDTLAEVERRHARMEENGTAGIPTGWPTMDERTGGPQPGEVWIIGARLGEMKSWCLQRMASTAAAAGYVVQFDALEQSRPLVAMRIHSFLSAEIGKELFSNTSLMQGKGFNLPAYTKFLKELSNQVRGRLHVSDQSRGRVSGLSIASQIERNKPDIVYVDYLQLMGKSRDWQEIAAISGELHQIAQEFQVPIIAASQLNRDRGTGKGDPGGADALSNADAIGHDADMIVNQRQISQSVLLHKCAKNRNGEGGFKFYTHAEPGKGIMREVSYNKAMDLKDEDKDREDAMSEKASVDDEDLHPIRAPRRQTPSTSGTLKLKLKK